MGRCPSHMHLLILEYFYKGEAAPKPALVKANWTTGALPSYIAVQIDFSELSLHLDSIPGLLPVPTHIKQRYCLGDMTVPGLRPYWTTYLGRFGSSLPPRRIPTSCIHQQRL